MSENVKSRSVLYFWASWCSVCKPLRASLEEWSVKYGASIVGVCVEDDKVESAKYGVQYLPTLVFLLDGVEQKRFVGTPEESEFAQAIAEAYDGNRN